MVYPRRAAEKTFFDPRRATKDHEENLCKVTIWAVHKGPRRKPFYPRRATKDHEENLCKVIIWAVHERAFFDPRQKTFCKIIIRAVHEGSQRKPFYPRRATKDHEEPLQGHYLGCPRRAAEKTFLSTKGHEGPRRKPLQGHNLGCPRQGRGENLFIHEGPRRTTKKTFARS